MFLSPYKKRSSFLYKPGYKTVLCKSVTQFHPSLQKSNYFNHHNVLYYQVRKADSQCFLQPSMLEES